jgi:hypothetical protein
MISRPAPTIKHPQIINSFGQSSDRYTPMNRIGLFLKRVLHGHSLQSVHVHNMTNIDAMSHRSDLLRVVIESIYKNTQCALL